MFLFIPDGFTYEKSAIVEWLVSRRKASPMTNLPLEDATLRENVKLKAEIDAFLKS